jgi:L-iditol 2-dehydrogenase
LESAHSERSGACSPDKLKLGTPTLENRRPRRGPANSAPCGGCFHCRAGQENLCEDLLFLNGAYAESIAVPARLVQKNLLRLKPETDFRDAALVEPLACVVQGVEDTQLRAGQNVLVIGAGPIGLMFVALAKNLGCHVTVAGRRAPRLEAAQRLGADRWLTSATAADWSPRFARQRRRISTR